MDDEVAFELEGFSVDRERGGSRHDAASPQGHMSATRAAKLLDVTWRAAQQNIDKLVDANILREVTGQKRNRIFLAEEIVRSIEG